jgi:hypothetical protein
MVCGSTKMLLAKVRGKSAVMLTPMTELGVPVNPRISSADPLSCSIHDGSQRMIEVHRWRGSLLPPTASAPGRRGDIELHPP